MVSTDHKIAGYLYPIAGRKTLTTSEILPSEFWRGITEFNQGEFYACHDTLEAIWMEAGEPEKTFYQGILQMAVALYHLGNRNVRGAIILLGEGMHRLRRYESDYGGINVDRLLQEGRSLQATLQQMEQSGKNSHPIELEQGFALPVIEILSQPQVEE